MWPIFVETSSAVPKAIEPSLQFIKKSERFRDIELPDCLGREDKIILAGRLLREGLLTVETSS